MSAARSAARSCFSATIRSAAVRRSPTSTFATPVAVRRPPVIGPQCGRAGARREGCNGTVKQNRTKEPRVSETQQEPGWRLAYHLPSLVASHASPGPPAEEALRLLADEWRGTA